jgi:hypothetical protein
MNAEHFNTLITNVRREAALAAYETALNWLQVHPAHEVERRLIAKVQASRQVPADEACPCVQCVSQRASAR